MEIEIRWVGAVDRCGLVGLIVEVAVEGGEIAEGGDRAGGERMSLAEYCSGP